MFALVNITPVITRDTRKRNSAHCLLRVQKICVHNCHCVYLTKQDMMWLPAVIEVHCSLNKISKYEISQDTHTHTHACGGYLYSVHPSWGKITFSSSDCASNDWKVVEFWTIERFKDTLCIHNFFSSKCGYKYIWNIDFFPTFQECKNIVNAVHKNLSSALLIRPWMGPSSPAY